MNDQFLGGISVAQIASEQTPAVVRRALDLAGQMARQLGAQVYVDEHFDTGDTFASRGKQALTEPAVGWLASSEQHFAIAAESAFANQTAGQRVVVLQADALCDEAVLFAQSGLSDLLGDPQRAPIVPTGSYGAGTVAYGLLAALTGLIAMQRRFAVADSASVDASGVLAWVNWKAAALGHLGRNIKREGDKAEWPVVRCKDGFAALVYQERDWPNIVAMVCDDRLAEERFRSFKGRAAARMEYMAILRDWAHGLTKSQINAAFLEFDIPAASVMDAADLLTDPLLQHREALVPAKNKSGADVLSPRMAHRVIAQANRIATEPQTSESLPLSGIRVLDLGIITAGAGVSALLADLGAEVIKVESHTYPDPFRQWAGEKVSPLFKCNNRNKYGVALDLKQTADKARFLALVETADVVVENFRRGVLDRLGLGYDVLRAANPGILLASISGQGLTGPGCGASSFGSTLEASSGFSAHVAYEDAVPFITGRNVNYPDQTVVLYAAAVITAALSNPTRGMQLDVSQRDVAVFLAGEEIELASDGSAVMPQDNGRAFFTRDERWVAFAPTPELQESISETLERWCASQDAQTLIGELHARSVPAALVHNGTQMFELFQVRSPYLFGNSPDGAMVKGFPFQFATNSMTVRLNSPAVGEHTDQFC